MHCTPENKGHRAWGSVRRGYNTTACREHSLENSILALARALTFAETEDLEVSHAMADLEDRVSVQVSCSMAVTTIRRMVGELCDCWHDCEQLRARREAGRRTTRPRRVRYGQRHSGHGSLRPTSSEEQAAVPTSTAMNGSVARLVEPRNDLPRIARFDRSEFQSTMPPIDQIAKCVHTRNRDGISGRGVRQH